MIFLSAAYEIATFTLNSQVAYNSNLCVCGGGGGGGGGGGQAGKCYIDLH